MQRRPLIVPRRDFLKGLGASVATGLGSGCVPLPVSGRPLVDTFVVVMMENRSFDQHLGALSLHEGRGDIDGLLAGMSNPDLDGNPVEIGSFSAPCVADPPHHWNSARQQMNNGANDGFVRAYQSSHGDSVDRAAVMAYHQRHELPILYSMADAYTVCDRWFSSVPGPTWPNRFYSLAAQSEGHTSNEAPSTSMRTIFDQLDEAGISWSYYFSVVPFLYTHPNFRDRPEVRPIEEFYEDCLRGTLPQVVWVDPQWNLNDDHPPAHPTMGQVFLGTVHNALVTSPHWSSSLMFVTYDEHGGFFDHVAPPTTVDDRAEQGFDQLGIRVPTVLCSPWISHGDASSDLFDHTSILATIQRHFGLEPLTTRNEAANDVLHLLDPLHGGQPGIAHTAELPTIQLSTEEILAECENPSGDRRSADLGQPELEALLDACEAPDHLDRRWEYRLCLERFLEQAERFGAARLVD